MRGAGFECDHCHTKVIAAPQGWRFGADVPDGWIVVAQQSKETFVDPLEFCSWACVAGHAAPRV